MILPKEYKHTEKNFWNACGFAAKDMDDIFKVLIESNNTIPASKGMAYIEELTISTRAKMALTFCLAGYLAKIKFDADMEAYGKMMKQEITRLQKAKNDHHKNMRAML